MEITQQAPDSKKISVHSEMLDVLSRVISSMMKEAQEEDVDINRQYTMLNLAEKKLLAQIRKIKLRPVQRYL